MPIATKAIKKTAKLVKKGLTTGTFLAYQVAFILCNAPVQVVEKSRRVGMTWAAAYRSVRRAALNAVPRADKSWFSSADDSAGQEYIDYCAWWCRQMQIKAVEMGEVLYDSEQDITSRAIRLANGKEIHALTSNAKQFRSKGGDGYQDEAAHHDNPVAMWKALNALKMWGGTISVFSTHNGPNSFFNRLVKKAKVTPRWAHQKVTIHDAIAQGMLDKILERKATKKDIETFLEELREDALDEDTWQQEFCCVPIDESTSLLPYDLLYPCEKDGILVQGIDDLRALKGNLYVGWDVARKKHLSVLWVFEELAGFLITRQIAVFDNKPFHVQQQAFYALLDLPNMRGAAVDNSGMGIVLAEQAQELYGPHLVEAVTFSNPVKEKLAMGFRSEFDDKRVLIPSHFDVREDLHSVKRTVTLGGAVRLEADDAPTFNPEATEAEAIKEVVKFNVKGGQRGGHADRFWAGALARYRARGVDNSPAFLLTRERRERTRGIQELERAFTDLSFRKRSYDAY